MKPRLRKVEGFWHCVTPDAQGIGVTPTLAHREYMDLLFDVVQDRIEADRKEYARKEIEYQTETAKINFRILMSVYGFETDDSGNVVKDCWIEALQSPFGADLVGFAPAPTPIRMLPAPRPAPRWWEFWK